MAKETEWVLVECVEHFRKRYICEVPKGKELYALDTVSMEKATEFSQKYLDMNIISHRVVTLKEALEICDEENVYASKWNDEQKLKAFFTPEIPAREPTAQKIYEGKT